MAYIREWKRKDGSVGHQVCWRVGGRNGTTKSETFEDPVMAGLFKSILEAQGEAEAQAWLDRQMPSTDSGSRVPTLDEFMEREIAHRTSADEGTRHDYGNVYRRMWSTQPVEQMGGHLLGELPVDAITRDMLAAIILRHAERLKEKTIANARGLLASAFHAMVDDPQIPVTVSPCKRLAIPASARPLGDDGQEGEDDDDGEVLCLTHEEFRLVYDEIPEYWRPLVLFLVGTGLRWSEATALKADRVDLTAGTIRITRAWKKVPGGYKLGPPKTKRSRRTVHLDPDQVDLVADHLGERSRTSFVFTGSQSGRSVDRSFYYTVWRPALWRASLCEKHRAHGCGHVRRTPSPCRREHCNTPPPKECGCPGTLLRRPRIHDLRHTHVAWLVDAGAQLPWISRRLGHESIKTTWDIYGDVLPKLQEQSLETVTASMAPLGLKAPRLRVVRGPVLLRSKGMGR